MAEGSGTSSTIVVCQQHKLRYDSATQSGCVICRREAGGAAPPAGAAQPRPGQAGARAAAGSAAPGSSGGMGSALGITGLLIALTTVLLFLMHSMIALFMTTDDMTSMDSGKVYVVGPGGDLQEVTPGEDGSYDYDYDDSTGTEQPD